MLEDFEVEDRARALVCFAARWDELHATLTGSGYGWMTNDRADDALIGAVLPYVHPLLTADRANLADLFGTLRQSVADRDAYQTFGVLPAHLESEFGDTYDRSRADEALDNDIDLALWPLLSAQALSCAECRRVRQDVTAWEPCEPQSGRCRTHRLVLAGAS